MLRGVSGNVPKKFTMVRKIHRENHGTSEDPSLSGIKAQSMSDAANQINATGRFKWRRIKLPIWVGIATPPH
ncbi:unnamed protein product [Gadus morhua 'NCC']